MWFVERERKTFFIWISLVFLRLSVPTKCFGKADALIQAEVAVFIKLHLITHMIPVRLRLKQLERQDETSKLVALGSIAMEELVSACLCYWPSGELRWSVQPILLASSLLSLRPAGIIAVVLGGDLSEVVIRGSVRAPGAIRGFF
ncbi:uncharacterized protein LOC116428741 [Nomia melanderi]|uniref:uncharacterized protein LOC116428741 n=1 Tax=Nomia melanderi TaxID=2448451 RepID=UPI00130404F7|nr:uncharacterized protein LOC116428741 [Nomia melanderi]